MNKPKHSFKDSRGHIYVDCTECSRGSGGEDPDKCASGWQVKRGGRAGCFSGKLRRGLLETDIQPRRRP